MGSLFGFAAFSYLLYVSPTLSQDVFVKDGDSFTLNGEEIRLWGIDAPEFDQQCTKGQAPYSCGQVSKRALERFIGSKTVICKKKYTDRYARSISQCSVEGSDLGAMMVQHGHAVDYERYSKGYYKTQELEAQRNKAGIWAGDFEKPWIWKRKK